MLLLNFETLNPLEICFELGYVFLIKDIYIFCHRKKKYHSNLHPKYELMILI